MIQIPAEDLSWVREIRQKLAIKISAMHDRLGSSVPYAAINGRYTDKMGDNLYWWCNGFWPGMLWLMYHDSEEDKYRLTARAVEERLDAALAGFEGLHHDVGFMWNLASVLDWKLTGDKTARTRALHAAAILAGRYNPRGHFLRAWNRDCTGWIIIDCMMNLSLLYWAGEQLGDPRFAFIARDHADTALEHLVREDGSCNHIAVLDPESGALVEAPAGQGYAPGSSWTRGQAWALYGFAISSRHNSHHSDNDHHNEKSRYAETARRVAGYFCGEVSRYGYIPPVDFRAPPEPKKIDTSAGVIAACGLLELASTAENEEAAQYSAEAFTLLRAIEAAHCDWDPATDGLVKMGTAQYHGKTDELHVPLIYGDYFFLEAIHRILHPEFQVW